MNVMSAIHQVRGRSAAVVAARRHRPAAAMAGADQPGAAHQARDTLAAVPFAPGSELGMHPRRAVGLARGDVHSADPPQ
jgi:hypothetical protein